MGLDMYLYAKKYTSIGSWELNSINEETINSFYPIELKNFQNEIFERNFLSKEETFQIGYWRKANAIHNWIVKNCARGIDECQKIYMSTEKLNELRDTCNEVLNDHEKADELLPTVYGFFFGGQEYDNWYFGAIEYTRDLLEKITTFLKENETIDNHDGIKSYYEIIYQASW